MQQIQIINFEAKHMKYIFLSFLLISVIGSSAQTSANDMQVTLTGIGPFKVNMKKTEVEKIINQKINTSNSNKKENYENDTVQITYKGASLTIVFYPNYTDENKTETSVYSISSSSAFLKTKSGITTGDDKIKIISTYNDFDFNYYYNYENDGEEDYKRSKTNSTLMLIGENSPSVLYFHFINN